MKKIVCISAFLFLIVFQLFSQSQDILPDTIVNQLKFGVEGFKNRYHSPGIVVLIVHDKKIIFSEAAGYVDLENKIPATIESKFPILSVTKTFTATMLMQLVERNQLRLEDNIHKYVPEWKPGTASKKDRISFMQLATHTSGLPRNSQADINFTKQVDKWLLAGTNDKTIEPATKKELLKSLKFIGKEYPDYELLSYGDRHYSNLGYSILGIALERAAKTNYSEYIKKNIFKPLQMDNSGFDDETGYGKNIAKGYYYVDSSRDFIKTPMFRSNSALYAGGMYSTATDLAKYLIFQFDGSEDANKILSKEQRSMMHAFKIGWKPSYPIVLHEGAMLGYRCQVAFNPGNKTGWVILTNTTEFEFGKMNEYINGLISQVYNQKAINDLNKYAGTYKLAGNADSLRIYLKDGKLYSTYLEDILPSSPLFHSGNNKFKRQGKGTYSINYDFIADENSEIKLLNMGQLMWVKE